MNYELIANGAKLGASIISTASGVSSVASFISGFSLSKDVQKIEASTRSIRDIQKAVEGIRDLNSSTNAQVKQVLSDMRRFTDVATPTQQYQIYDKLLTQFATQSDYQIQQFKKITEEILHEFKNVLQATQFSQGKPQMVSHRLLSDIVKNPSDFGMKFSPDSTAQFLDQCGMVTSSSSPTLLSTSHQNYYGTIDNRVLKSYGVNVSYKQSLSGYFLDAASGLFLPTILISNIM